MNDKLACLH
jgi:hypothetical protein